MDQWKTNGNSSEPRQRDDVKADDAISPRKVQKADRERLRRDKLNEQFQELGNIVDSAKNDKASILTDAIQVLKDLTSEVSKLKTEHTVLHEESLELTQEKNDLREEKASLKSDVENLNAQYEQALRFMIPWGAVNPSITMAPPFSYPVGPLPFPPGPIPMHPTIPPFPNPNPILSYIPYPTPVVPLLDHPTTLNASTSFISSRQDSISRISDQYRSSTSQKAVNSNNVVTDLELKIPGSTVQKEVSSGEKNGKQPMSDEKKLYK
ncbi:transcription factor bHLH121-like [Olea europaea var. sylvestris]|uniref:Transcription factor bHLH121-like n=1 Tax=Olea europaea subsp. europaea TaxID=158383 RepID=A0A8S0VEE6_OLEEU|nr:transcription factor bHLH121-like [Olea europaea var. sylvestris]CAA3028989.1 transcription factor bHLH121-like [Olea europaea subsp. europaea]